jgi:RNA polymerase sigma-70 factor (ECF subfamily)
MMVGPDAAEDVYQEARMRAWTARSTLRDPAKLRAWFLSIVVNQARTWHRRRFLGLPLEEWVPDRSAGPEERYEHWERDSGLRKALRSLSPKHRAVVVLRFYEDLSVDEIAEVVGCPSGTVKSRLHHALRHLQTLLGPSASWAPAGEEVR